MSLFAREDGAMSIGESQIFVQVTSDQIPWCGEGSKCTIELADGETVSAARAISSSRLAGNRGTPFSRAVAWCL